jgi:2-oxoglutarate decarboxylase
VPVLWRKDEKPSEDSLESVEKQAGVLQLINMYRVRGHLIANLDPLKAKTPQMHLELDPASYGFTIWDLERRFVTGGLAGRRELPLGEILHILRDAYCRTGTVEYMPGARRGRPPGAGQGGPAPDPAQAQRGRGLRALPAQQVHRPQALQP